MRKLLLLSLLPLIIFSQKIIETDIFTVNYSEKLEQPLWLEYDIFCIDGDYKRSGMGFKKFEGVHTSDALDYKYNVWDKGHLAPAATFDCSENMLLQTFTYINCALQHSKLNRGPWASLERYERKLAESYDVSVRIDLIFDNESIILPTGATVPDYFVKTINYNDKSIKVKFPNSDVSGVSWDAFLIEE
tara:strand:- start:232 stop:798 length:567 start_codon:yes stop_codon:yes gene_type:complete